MILYSEDIEVGSILRGGILGLLYHHTVDVLVGGNALDRAVVGSRVLRTSVHVQCPVLVGKKSWHVSIPLCTKIRHNDNCL